MPNSNVLVGHETRWAGIARAFDRDQVPQSLLLSGPPHVGKWTFAVRLVQLLLCPKVGRDEAGSPAPCGHCRSCHQVAIETHPDFRVYRPIVSAAKEEKDWVVAPEELDDSGIYIDIARKIGDEAMRKPLVGPRKVMVLQGADKMNDEAQNALLKTFEEPVQGLSIVLLATNPNKLLPTVQSRCWHLPLGLVSDTAVAGWLLDLFPDAPEAVTEPALLAAAGCPGAAKRELQRLLSVAEVADTQSSSEALGTTARYSTAQRVVERICSSQPVGALGLTEEAVRLAREWWQEDYEGKELKKGDSKIARSSAARFLDELSKVYRERWKIEVEQGAAGAADGAAWADGLDRIRKTRHYILRNANTSLALDVMFGRLIAAQN